MKINKSQKRLLIILGIILVCAILDITMNPENYTYYFKEEREEQTFVEDSSFTENVEIKIEKNSYNKNWDKDPFSPAVTVYGRAVSTKAGSFGQLHLKAISYGAKKSAAIINGKILKTGDKILGYRIEQIKPDTVIVSRGKSKFKLTLK